MWSVAPARVSWVSVVSRWIRAAEEDVSSSVLKVRMPISEPLAAIAFSESGFWMATEPSMKNVAGTRKCWSTASSSAVRSGCGPPSKVRATVAFLSAKVCTGCGAGLDDLLAVRDDERDLLHGGLLGRLVRRHADAAANGAVDHEDRREDQEGDH